MGARARGRGGTRGTGAAVRHLARARPSSPDRALSRVPARPRLARARHPLAVPSALLAASGRSAPASPAGAAEADRRYGRLRRPAVRRSRGGAAPRDRAQGNARARAARRARRRRSLGRAAHAPRAAEPDHLGSDGPRPGPTALARRLPAPRRRDGRARALAHALLRARVPGSLPDALCGDGRRRAPMPSPRPSGRRRRTSAPSPRTAPEAPAILGFHSRTGRDAGPLSRASGGSSSRAAETRWPRERSGSCRATPCPARWTWPTESPEDARASGSCSRRPTRRCSSEAAL